jgi:hypothetical protein
VAEEGGIANAGGVGGGREIIAANDAGQRLAHTVPSPVTPERHADLSAKQMLKARWRQAYLRSQAVSGVKSSWACSCSAMRCTPGSIVDTDVRRVE